MFEGIIRNKIKKHLKTLKQYNIQLALKTFHNASVIVSSNLPSNYEFVFSKMIDDLGKVGVVSEIGTLRDEDVVLFKNLPSQYLGLVKSCIDEYNSGRI